MLPLPVGIFITQLVALLGVAAIARILLLIAYYLKDIDVQLMYHENIFRHLEWYRDFKSSNLKKSLVIWSALVATVVSFLPTFLSIAITGNETTPVSYRNIKKTYADGVDLKPTKDSEDDYPIFTNFYSPNQTPANSTGILLENFIYSRHQKTYQNPTGVWYNPLPYYYTPEQEQNRNSVYPQKPQIINDQGFFLLQNSLRPSYFLAYSKNNKVQGSSTLESCVDNDPLKSNIVNNMTSIDGHLVQGVRSVNQTCFPITDPSLWLVAAKRYNDDVYKSDDSLLNTNQDVYYRPAFINQQSLASYSMGVSANGYAENGQMAVMIKKSAHITVFYDDNTRALSQDNCAADLSNKFTFNQDINLVACQLVALAKQNPTLPMLQATKRTIEANKMINSVYTYIKKENGHGIMIDLTLYYAYYFGATSELQTHFPELLVAYQKVEKKDFDTSDFKQLLESINPFPDVDTESGLNVITSLVLVGSRLTSGYISNEFIQTTASVILPISIAVPWVTVTYALAIIFTFILIVTSRFIPATYKTDLRSLLVHTLIAQEMDNATNDNSDLPLSRKRKTGLFTRSVRFDRKNTLTMDGSPIFLVDDIPLTQHPTAIPLTEQTTTNNVQINYLCFT